MLYSACFTILNKIILSHLLILQIMLYWFLNQFLEREGGRPGREEEEWGSERENVCGGTICLLLLRK